MSTAVRSWIRSPRGWVTAFVATALILSGALGVVGWRLLDRESTQQDDRRNELAADQLVASFESRLAAVTSGLDVLLAAGEPPTSLWQGDDVVVVRLDPGALRAWPEGRLAFFPDVPEPLTADADRVDQGTLLVRRASASLNRGDPAAAVRAYEALSALGPLTVAGMPADLAGRLGLLDVYDGQHDGPRAEETARGLWSAVTARKWPIRSATYGYLLDRLRPRLPAEVMQDDARALSLATAIETAWLKADGGAREGQLVMSGPQPALVAWKTTGSVTGIFAAGASYLESRWVVPSAAARVTLSGAEGQAALGTDREVAGQPAVRLATDTRLPWTLKVFGTITDADVAVARSRQQLFALAMVLVVALILSGAALMNRAVSRELAVARQQSEFVSTVSHEFRTPLASLCQLSELLDDGRVATDADRQTYYRFLRHESERLRRLVEGLLQFGRVEAGTLQLRFDTVGAASFLRSCADEFVASGQLGRHRLDFDVVADAPIHIDRDALTCVLWNLLENAVKYSPGADVIRVRLSAHPRRVEIAVSDDGPGIPKAEQARIFEKFTRGSAAVSGQIRGAGIGLSTAREIAKALGGDIVVDSEPGRGSTFTVRLPVATAVETGEPASLVRSSREL